MILKAAVLQKDSRIVYVGHRHGDVFEVMRDAGVRYKYCTQGFVDAEGNFLDRREAYAEAVRCGQIEPKNDYNTEIRGLELEDKRPVLTSEDLY